MVTQAYESEQLTKNRMAFDSVFGREGEGMRQGHSERDGASVPAKRCR